MNTELSNKINELMKARSIPGVAIGVYNKGEIISQGYGITNVDHPLPVDDDTLFQIGSITKTFVGTMTMMLVEEGKLDLDAPIQTYLPDFKVQDKEASGKATIRHLFTHTAGWVGDWFPAGIDQGSDSVEQYVETMKDTPQLTSLGKYLSYNNAGYNLAGRILEVVTGKVFDELVKEMILKPLSMEDTHVLPWEMMQKRFASGHKPGENGVQVVEPWFIGRASGPAGGIVSSVKDMIKYIKLHLGETDIVSKESLEALHTPQLEYAPARNIALTFWVDDHRSARSMGHSGGTVGQQALLTIVPEHNFGVMIGTNCATGAVAKYQMADAALKAYLGVETPELAIIKMTKEDLHEYEGEYEAKLSAVKIEAGEDGLLIRSKYLGGFPTADDMPEESEYGDPAGFGFYAKDHINGLDETNNISIAQFIREDGKVTMVRSGMRLHKRVH